MNDLWLNVVEWKFSLLFTKWRCFALAWMLKSAWTLHTWLRTRNLCFDYVECIDVTSLILPWPQVTYMSAPKCSYLTCFMSNEISRRLLRCFRRYWTSLHGMESEKREVLFGLCIMFEVTCWILIATYQSSYCLVTRECIDVTCWMWTRWCQSTWCPDAEFHLHPRLDPVVICNSVYRKGLSDLFLLCLVLFFVTHFHWGRGYSHCYSALSCYSVTHFHYYRCCISCYPVLLLYPVTYFHSYHCYADRYPVLLLLYPVTHFYSCLYFMRFYTVLRLL